MDIEHRAAVHPAMERDQARDGTACVVQRILYCHGFASNFDPEKEKVRVLSTLAPVDGVTVDYTLAPSQVFAAFSGAIVAQKKHLDRRHKHGRLLCRLARM